MSAAFDAVYARLHELIAGLERSHFGAVAACRLIQTWLDEGCDAQLDILPAINGKWAHTPSGVKVTSPAYFSKAVTAARDKRLQSADHVHAKMKSIAYATRKLGRRMPAEERELKDYEAKHGPIE
jgi:hypothetical protein